MTTPLFANTWTALELKPWLAWNVPGPDGEIQFGSLRPAQFHGALVVAARVQKGPESYHWSAMMPNPGGTAQDRTGEAATLRRAERMANAALLDLGWPEAPSDRGLSLRDDK